MGKDAQKPDCYACRWRGTLPGNAHSRCLNPNSPTVGGSPHGVRMGWFFWPYNFDPMWLASCGGFETKP